MSQADDDLDAIQEAWDLGHHPSEEEPPGFLRVIRILDDEKSEAIIWINQHQIAAFGPQFEVTTWVILTSGQQIILAMPHEELLARLAQHGARNARRNR